MYTIRAWVLVTGISTEDWIMSSPIIPTNPLYKITGWFKLNYAGSAMVLRLSVEFESTMDSKKVSEYNKLNYCGIDTGFTINNKRLFVLDNGILI